MKLALTDINGKEIVVDSDHVKLMEPAFDKDSGNAIGTHIVFGSDLGRVVSETPASIAAILGAVAVPHSNAVMIADVAKGKKR